MLTGDAYPIAKQIAQQVSLGPRIINLTELKKNKIETIKSVKNEILFDIDVENVDGFAEIYPEDKHSIVTMIQKKKYIVGMTGDGVNDGKKKFIIFVMLYYYKHLH